jgi:integrase
MPIVQRGQSFQVTVNNAKVEPKRWRRQFTTEIEARAWEADAKLRVSRGEQPDMGESKATTTGERPGTLRELANYMLKHHWAGSGSVKTTTINMNTMVEIIGPDTKIGEISSHTVNVALGMLRDQYNYPNVTINKKLSTLRVILKYALKEGWIDRLPNIPFFKTGEGRIRFFTPEEEKEQLDWCKATLNYDLLDYIVVSYDTGMRQGEVLELKSRNVADKRVTLWGRKTELDRGTKAGNTRSIPLTPRAREVLERRAMDLKPHELLFPFTKDQLKGMWNRMRDALGFTDDPEYVAHVMRHTFCTRLVKAKVNLAVIQKLAGHLRIETTLRYVKVDDDVMVEAIEDLNKFQTAPKAEPELAKAA